MKRFSIYAFIAFTLTMIIPMPGRFVYGVVLALEFNFLVLFGSLINSFINKLKLNELKSFLYIFFFIIITVLFRQILKITQPEIALTLGILTFFPSVSIFLLGYIFTNTEKKLSEKIKIDMKDSLFYTIYLLVFNLLSFLFYAFGQFFPLLRLKFCEWMRVEFRPLQVLHKVLTHLP